ncbi:MAG: hypothetical protein IKM39_03545 [Clostridia bacterium]|nr:hypothetical protein [Clostridia bacterium]
MLKRLYLYFVFALVAVATGVRTWELSAAIDPSGFYLPAYETLCQIIGYAALALVVGLLLIGRLSLKPQGEIFFPKKNPLLGSASLLLMLACVLQGVSDYSSATTDLMGLIGAVTCFATALSYGVIGISLLQGKTVPFGAAALPVVSHLGYLVLQYANFNGIAQISENMIFILFICSFLALLMSQCRILTGINAPKGVAFGYGTATATALFGLCASVPHWIMGQNQFPVSFMGFGAAVYALVFLYQLPQLELEEV